MKQEYIMVISNNDLDYLFDDTQSNYIVTYIDDIALLNSVMHIDNLDYIILDSRIFKKNFEIYEAFEKLKLVNNPSKIYIVIDKQKTNLLWLTDFLIKTGFTNFLSTQDFRNFNTQQSLQNKDEFKLDFEVPTGNSFIKYCIKKRNNRKEIAARNAFYGKQILLPKIKQKILISLLIVVVLFMLASIITILNPYIIKSLYDIILNQID